MSTLNAVSNLFGEARAAEIVRRASTEAAAVRAEIAELRSTSLENPQTPLSFPAEWLIEAWGGGATDSGIRVSEMTALAVSTVYACVNLIASAIAGLDFSVYERFSAANKRVGRRLADDHYLFDLLQTEPNHEMTAFTYRKTLMCHALLWGNQYAEIERNGAGQAIALWPRNPAKTRPHRILKSGLLVYKTSEGMDDVTIPGPEIGSDGQERTIFAENMVHVPGLAIDGRLGQSVVWLARQAIGLALATEKYGSKLFANGARPGGILVHPGKLQPKAREVLKQTWHEAQGGENAHKVAVLEDGMKFETISQNNEEVQFLQTREHQKLEICSLYSVPPHMIGDAGKAGGKNNLEQIGGEFVTFTLAPWLKAQTQEYERKLFPRVGQHAKKFFPHFDTRPLIMPDAASRKDFYGTGKQWGFLNTDSILELEGLNPTEQPGSDLYWMPVNMGIMTEEGALIPVGQDRNPQGGGTSPKGQGDGEGTNKDTQPAATKIGKRLARTYSGLFADAFRRVSGRKEADSDAYQRTLTPVLQTIANHVQDLAIAQFIHGDEIQNEQRALIHFCEPPGEDRFMTDLIEGIRKRKVDGETPENLTERELPRVIRALTIMVYRDLATRIAKERTEDVKA